MSGTDQDTMPTPIPPTSPAVTRRTAAVSCCPVCAQLDALDGLGVVPTLTTRSQR